MAAAIRQPAVVGRFYPADPGVLLADVRSYLSPIQTKVPAIGCIAPHAGYMYSGPVAGSVYARIQVPRRCIVLGPNHTGLGHPLAIMSEGAWNTPIGSIPIDSVLAAAIQKQFPALTEDTESQRKEHAIEVQLPFLRIQQRNLSFVPVTLGTGRFEILEELGEAIANVMKGEITKNQAERILIVASSDMNHYESDEITRIKDHKAIMPILDLDARELFEVVMRENISMCGFGPAVTMITAAKSLGGTFAELVQYATSGDVSGDLEHVVGYAGIVIS
ncbi:MAG: MEMO1 family protein [Terriglobales bacterium]